MVPHWIIPGCWAIILPRFLASASSGMGVAWLCGGDQGGGWLDVTVIHPCARAMVLSMLHSIAWAGLVVALARVAAAKERKNKSVRKAGTFAFVQAATMLLGVAHTLVTAWNCLRYYHHGRDRLLLHRLIFPLTQAVAWATSLLLLAYEESHGLAHHLAVLRAWWALSCMSGSVHALCGLVSWIVLPDQGAGIIPGLDLFTAAGTALLSLALLLVTPRGATGLRMVEAIDTKEALLAGGSSNTGDPERVTRYARAGYVSKALFLWVDPLLKTGSTRTLEVDDIPELAVEDRAETLCHAFELNWAKQADRSVALALMHSRRWPLAFTGLLYLLKVSVMYVGPLMIQHFIDFASKPGGHWSQGVGLVSLLLVAKMVEELTERQRNFGTRKLSLSVRSSLVAAVFRKSLRLSNSARQEHGTGQIVNYMSVDVEEIANFVLNLHNLWIMPIQIAIALAILFRVVGVSTVAGLASMITLMAFCLFISSRQRKYWKQIMACKDARMKVTNEAITNMKIIKMQAWQDWFLRLVEKARDKEQVWASKIMYIGATSIFFLWLSPLAVSVATFGMCVIVGKELTAGRVFTAIATFRILQDPLRAFPSVIMAGSQAATSLTRLKRYLESDEIDALGVERRPPGIDNVAVLLENATFKWSFDGDKPVLDKLDVRVEAGSLVTVVGTVGSGKSSFLACILGEMDKVSGTVFCLFFGFLLHGLHLSDRLFCQVKVSGRAAYVSQCPWIQNGTIRDNILFGNAMNLQRYRQTLQVCCLQADLAQFVAGDLTVIGERGFNLSGGQKQRIQLARAVYQDADVYLLDDIFSAVDAHTGTALFMVMKQGRVVQSGKFEELLEHGVHFSDLVQAHHQALQLVDVGQGMTGPENGRAFDSGDDFQISQFNADESAQAEDVEEEERAKGRVDGRVYWAYVTQAFGGFHVIVFLLIQSAWQGLQIASDFWLAHATSDKNKPFFRPRKFILVYSLLALGSGVFVLMRSTLISYCGLVTAQKLYLSMLRSIFRAPISFFDATPTGRILTRRYFIATSRELTRLKSITDAPVIHHFKETIAGLMSIRAFGHQERFARVNMERIDINVRMSFHNGAANDWLSFRLETIGIVILCFSALFLVLLPKSFVNPEFVGLSLSYGLALSGCLNYMIFYICQIEQNMVAVERILQFSSIEAEEQSAGKDAGRISSSLGKERTWFVWLLFCQLRYRPGLPLVLKDVTFVVQGGEKLGVVGRTGSGKSSFIQALFRLVEPVQGTIFIDGIDIRSISLNDLRSRLSIIPQDPTLFEGTVRSNIDPLGMYQDEEIWEALEKCQLAETVKQSELKLGAQVAENGENWSMGQRQLFCLGRVLLKRSRILVLDEATASIDTHTDWILQKIIKEEFLGSTVISIAHRIPSVMDSDKVLVLDNGTSKEFASPSTLLRRRDSLFAGLVHEYWSRSKSAQNLTAMIS
ncbi:ABC transporter C family member 14 [Selaginella moellendorffii]|uniref:ABC transporter C family member 14 n=1 Tax=Selaginella moellendorffii TaxID=88036 RepID=UPI000D1CB180|nr:ABC transporter C family member 14 [Selaginella moellendorffii]|eukprot:XP_024531100.1 ABC transporter C family member 14 [Selaginella moellendorffii]